MNEATITRTLLVDSEKYANWVLGATHPTQGRRFKNASEQFIKAMNEADRSLKVVAPRLASKEELERVHSAEYIDEVIQEGFCGEWDGERHDLSELASLFVGGTLIALEKLLTYEVLTAIHFPGAKHHAQREHSSGFCVFADFALAAEVASNDFGKRVAILDIDAHHGDGTENLTIENKRVLTFSIHQYGIYPGTGYSSEPSKEVFNYPLASSLKGHDEGTDDQALARGIEKFLAEAKRFNPDLLFIACGADGHLEDPLTSLEYSVDGYVETAKTIKANFPNTPILFGGAGGYLPDTRTPEIWSKFALEISNR